MRIATERILFWAPRILGLLFAAFTSIFALDVFDETTGLLATAGALLLHLIPTIFVLLLVTLAWRRELLGALLFVAVAAVYVASTWGRFPLLVYVTIAGPVAAAGLLFFAHWLYSRSLRRSSVAVPE